MLARVGLTTSAHAIALSSGWPRRLIAMVAGAVGALALAPVDLLPAMVVPMTVAVWLIDGADAATMGASGPRVFWPSLRAAAASGWWWGLGYFVAGLWWLGAACLVEPDKFAWALPIAVLGVPSILAIFPAIGFALARALWLPNAGRILCLTLGLGVSEWLRGFVLTGFPWNDYGMALGNHLALAQFASVVGAKGLDWLAIAICAAPATLADGIHPKDIFARFGPLMCAVAALAALAIFGSIRLAEGPTGYVAGVKLRIMQPNMLEDAAFTYANRHRIIADYLALSDKATSATTSGLADVTHLIWPESAFPFILSRDSEAIETIAAALPAGTTLITGAARVEGQPGASLPPRYYNAIQVLTRDSAILDTYDKVHLVPFGEYLPLDGLLERLGVQHFVSIPGGFTAATRRRLLNAPGLPPIVAAICYEAIFSDEIMPDIPDAIVPGLILNLTNDSWFGATAGPYQHISQVRLRAIEQGLPLIRAANTGISAIIDPYGRIVEQTPLGVATVLDGPLPDRIKRPRFVKFRSYLDGVIVSILLTMILFLRLRYRQMLYPAAYRRTSVP